MAYCSRIDDVDDAVRFIARRSREWRAKVLDLKSRVQCCRGCGRSARRTFDRDNYHDAAEASDAIASQIPAQTPSDKSNTMVIDAPSDQWPGVRSPIHRTADR
jgi:hypothetical protein